MMKWKYLLLVLTLVASVHSRVLRDVPVPQDFTPAIEQSSKTAQIETENTNKQQWVLPGKETQEDGLAVEIVNDPGAGDRGITAVKDITLGACFIDHYFDNFVLPSVQRQFYVKHLPGTIVESDDDEEDFKDSVGPVVASHCAKLVSYWLDLDLFYRFSTKMKSAASPHVQDLPMENPAPFPMNHGLETLAKHRKRIHVLSPNIHKPRKIAHGEMKVPPILRKSMKSPVRVPIKIIRIPEPIRNPQKINFPVPKILSAPHNIREPPFAHGKVMVLASHSRESMDVPKIREPVPNIRFPEPTSELKEIPAPVPKIPTPVNVHDLEPVPNFNESPMVIPPKLRTPMEVPEVAKEPFPVPPKKFQVPEPPMKIPSPSEE